ncbi:MAG: cyclic nucleotide-binding domain-containing protein [Burkholderiaceae bacterium]|nr:cyclic nucleotide-binding domain-containing protein [Burkholderiaceae bacterium]
MSERFPGLAFLGDASSFVDRILEIIEHIRLFEDFEREEIRKLAAGLRCYRAPAGAALIREGDSGDFMVFLLDGQCEIVKNDPTGLPQRIGLAGPGKILGEMSMIDGEPRFASCIALGDTLFAMIDRDGLSRIIADDPRFGIKILLELVLLLSQRLRATSSRLVRGTGEEI